MAKKDLYSELGISKTDALFVDDGISRFLTRSVVDQFGNKHFCLISDIEFLLSNKSSLSHLDSGLIGILNDHFSGSSDSVSLDGFSDDEKLSVLKSRYSQTPTQLENFSQFLSENHSQILSDLVALRSDTPDTPPVEPASSPDGSN